MTGVAQSIAPVTLLSIGTLTVASFSISTHPCQGYFSGTGGSVTLQFDPNQLNGGYLYHDNVGVQTTLTMLSGPANGTTVKVTLGGATAEMLFSGGVAQVAGDPLNLAGNVGNTLSLSISY